MFSLIGCNHTDPKKYFVKQIPSVCEYPFNDITKFAVTCRVWGFLKYYHPNVTAGKLDWDKVLLDRLDRINEARTSEQVNAELMAMIHAAGAYERSTDWAWNDSLNMNLDLCWLNHSFINDSIRLVFKELKSRAVEQPSYYVSNNTFGALIFDNEKDYITIEEYEYRLLALFRYWNVIYYFFPYKYLMDQPWDETLEEFIPVFMNAHPKSYRKALLRLTTRLNDGHAFSNIVSLANPYQSNITMVDSLTVVRNPPDGSTLRRGDIILTISGKDIKTWRDSVAALIASSNQHYTKYQVNAMVNKAIMEDCPVTVSARQQELKVRENERARIHESPELFHVITPDISYVNLDLLRESDLPLVMDSLEKTGWVIFDLRSYPTKFNPRDFFCYLAPTQDYARDCYAQAIVADMAHCGAFYRKKFFINLPEEKLQGCKKYKGKIVVLVNAITMSAAETSAMEFQRIGATLVGTPTAGANGDIARLPMPGGVDTYFSSIGLFHSDGTEMQRKGVIPDIEVYPTMESIMEGKDEILEQAISYINHK